MEGRGARGPRESAAARRGADGGRSPAPPWTLLPPPTPLPTLTATTSGRKRKRGRWISPAPSRRLALMADNRVGVHGLEKLAAAKILAALLAWLDDASLAALDATARFREARHAVRLAWEARLRHAGRAVFDKYTLVPSACPKKAYLFHEHLHRRWRSTTDGAAMDEADSPLRTHRKVSRIGRNTYPFKLQMLRLSDSERDREFCATSILASSGPHLKLAVHDLGRVMRAERGDVFVPDDSRLCTAQTNKIIRSCALTGSYGDATLVTGSSEGLQLWSHRGAKLHSELRLPNGGASVTSLHGRWDRAQVISGDSQGCIGLWDVCHARRITCQTAANASFVCPHGDNDIVLATKNEVWRWDPRSKPLAHAGLQLVYQDESGGRISGLGAYDGRFVISKGTFQGLEMHELRARIGNPKGAVALRGRPFGGEIHFDHGRLLARTHRIYINQVALSPELNVTQTFGFPVLMGERDRRAEFLSDANSTCVVRSDDMGNQIYLWDLEPLLEAAEPFSYEACFAPIKPPCMPKATSKAPSDAAPAAPQRPVPPLRHEHGGVLLAFSPPPPRRLPAKELGGVRLL